MTGSQKKQFRKRFGQHRYPVKTFRGDPMRPAYTLYSLWEYPTYLAAANELDELLEQWPHNQPRALALLAVQAAFYENGAPHWAEQLVWDEDQANVHARMLRERQRARRLDPVRAARHAQHVGQAEAALVENQRRKQGPQTGKVPRRAQRPAGPKPVHISRVVREHLLCEGTKDRKATSIILAAFLSLFNNITSVTGLASASYLGRSAKRRRDQNSAFPILVPSHPASSTVLPPWVDRSLDPVEGINQMSLGSAPAIRVFSV